MVFVLVTVFLPICGIILAVLKMTHDKRRQRTNPHELHRRHFIDLNDR